MKTAQRLGVFEAHEDKLKISIKTFRSTTRRHYRDWTVLRLRKVTLKRYASDVRRGGYSLACHGHAAVSTVRTISF